jgi:hypothetical protein
MPVSVRSLYPDKRGPRIHVAPHEQVFYDLRVDLAARDEQSQHLGAEELLDLGRQVRVRCSSPLIPPPTPSALLIIARFTG